MDALCGQGRFLKAQHCKRQWNSCPPRLDNGRVTCRSTQWGFELVRGSVPASYSQESVVPGERTLVTPRLTPERVYQRLSETVHEHADKTFGAFFSSELGGIIDHPGFMIVHMDDHMVHHGHAVYETIILYEGYLYQLDEHLHRLFGSAEFAGIPVPASEAQLKRIILDTAAASGKLTGVVKVWVSSGRGGFGASDTECVEPGLYALVTTEAPQRMMTRHRGWRVAPSPVEPLADYFSCIKSTSAIQHVVCQLEAESRGYDKGVFVSADDVVLEGSDFSVAIITKELHFVTTALEGRLPGITVQTLAGLIPENYDDQDLPIKEVESRPITVSELLEAVEVMAVSTSMGVVPITHWGEQPIADGTAGYMALALHQVLENDREPAEGSGRHLPVPYGFLTGMKSQLV